MIRRIFSDFNAVLGLRGSAVWTGMLLVLCGIGYAQVTPPQTPSPQDLPVAPGLGQYADMLSKECGKHKVDEHPASIPTIGCFSIQAGRSLHGEIEGRKVTMRVLPKGDEIFLVDGVEIRKVSSADTNDPRVRVSDAGFLFCTKDPHDCPVMIDSVTRQPGSFSVFVVSRKVNPYTYVSNQENWDAIKAQQK